MSQGKWKCMWCDKLNLNKYRKCQKCSKRKYKFSGEDSEEEAHFREAIARVRRTKIYIQLERDGKYIRKDLTPGMMCALFDLQFMIDGAWDTIKLNKMEEDVGAFFRIIELMDDALHGNQIGTYNNKTKKLVWSKKKNGDFIFGRPNWRKLK